MIMSPQQDVKVVPIKLIVPYRARSEHIRSVACVPVSVNNADAGSHAGHSWSGVQDVLDGLFTFRVWERLHRYLDALVLIGEEDNLTVQVVVRADFHQQP